MRIIYPKFYTTKFYHLQEANTSVDVSAISTPVSFPATNSRNICPKFTKFRFHLLSVRASEMPDLIFAVLLFMVNLYVSKSVIFLINLKCSTFMVFGVNGNPSLNNSILTLDATDFCLYIDSTMSTKEVEA